MSTQIDYATGVVEGILKAVEFVDAGLPVEDALAAVIIQFLQNGISVDKNVLNNARVILEKAILKDMNLD